MIGADAPGFDGTRPGKGRHHTLAEYSQEELIAKWEEFFAEMGYESEIIGLADRYPEARTLRVRFEDMNRFDTDMSIYLLRHPLNVLAAGEEGIRRIVPPTEEALEIHLRVLGLPRDARVQIRDLRAKHLGRAIAVEGLVRKATEVRPMLVDALFQCLRCGTVIKEPQEGQSFREPLECYEDQGGCGKSASSTKFNLLSEASRFLDTQKIEIQEAPEGLRGGEEPQRLAAFMEDDLTGKITPGMRVVLNGILRSSQKGRPGQRSTLFDIFLDVNSIELEQVEFEEIEVTEEDIKQIEAEAAQPDIFQKIVASIAPSIYGLTTEKEALALQLFSGVPKVMPDGRRIRGDLHVLLIGDPGTAKSELLSYMSRLSPRGIYATGKAATAAGLCVSGESLLATATGLRPIRDVVEGHFRRAKRRHAIESAPARGEIATIDKAHRARSRPMEVVWRLRSPPTLLEIETAAGRRVRVTPATRLLVDHSMNQSWIPAKFIRRGMRIGTAHSLSIPEQEPPLIFDLLQGINSRIVVDVDPTLVDEIIQRLADRFGSVREAAARLLIDEDALYHRWRDGRHAVPLSALTAVADVANVPKPQLASAIRRYSQAGGHWIRLPQRLDPDLAHFAGLIAGDGSIELGARGGYSIRFNNSEESLVREYCALASRLFGVTPELTPRSPERAASCRFHSALVAAALGHLGIPPSPKSASVIIPEILLNAPGTILSSYLRGLFDTDGSVSVRQAGSSCLSLSTISRRLAEGVQTALLRFGIHARVRTRHVAGRRSIRFDGREIVSRHDQYVVEMRDGHSMTRFRNLIGLSHPAKARKLAEILEGRAHSNVDLISAAGPHLREVRGLLGLGNSQAYRGHRGIGAAIERGSRASTHATLGELIDALEQAYRSGEWEGYRLALSRKLRDAVRDVLRAQGIGSKTLAAKLGISRDRALEYFFRAERRTTRIPIRVLEKLAWLLRTLDADIAALIEAEIRPLQRRIASIPRRLEFLGSLASTDVRWDPVATVRPVPAEEEGTVYDLTVRDAHAFFANGILIHNTAAAVRDEFGEGRWTLEAGALVLADKGLACLHPDAEVVLDGVPVAVEEIFDETKAVRATAGGHEIEICPLDAETISFNSERLIGGRARVAFVTRRRYIGPV
ncbi:MAG: LAGLIDADG family homing endonuclease, partial [Candidatus Thermoplasmatota archaeon]